jgi:hypothetical protein
MFPLRERWCFMRLRGSGVLLPELPRHPSKRLADEVAVVHAG